MQSWLANAIALALSPDPFAENQSLNAQIETALGIKPAEATEITCADKATPEDAKALQVPRGTPLLSTNRWL
jgi:DNA-binding GntR family transcriptional regulator